MSRKHLVLVGFISTIVISGIYAAIVAWVRSDMPNRMAVDDKIATLAIGAMIVPLAVAMWLEVYKWMMGGK